MNNIVSAVLGLLVGVLTILSGLTGGTALGGMALGPLGPGAGPGQAPGQPGQNPLSNGLMASLAPQAAPFSLAGMPPLGNPGIPGAPGTPGTPQAPAPTTPPAAGPVAPGTPVQSGPEGSSAPLWVKSGAEIGGLRPEITGIFSRVVDTWNRHGGPTPVITSGTDGRHSAGSLHYSGRAVDLRANNIPDSQAQSIANDLRAQLGGSYDVIFERFPGNPDNNHIHIEYDPK